MLTVLKGKVDELDKRINETTVKLQSDISLELKISALHECELAIDKFNIAALRISRVIHETLSLKGSTLQHATISKLCSESINPEAFKALAHLIKNEDSKFEQSINSAIAGQ
jgi:hypothetical protein